MNVENLSVKITAETAEAEAAMARLIEQAEKLNGSTGRFYGRMLQAVFVVGVASVFLAVIARLVLWIIHL